MSLAKHLLVLLLPTAIALAAGGPAAAGAADAEHGEIELEPPEEGPVFGYSGDIAPGRWAELDPAYRLCGDGLAQSPIDIDALDAILEDRPDMQFLYQPSPLQLRNNGHTLQMNYEPGSSLVIDGSLHQLLQFHFHTPSEHTFEGGASFPLELHLVHRDASDSLTVVAVMIREGRFGPGLPDPRRLKQLLPVGEGVVVRFEDSFLDASRLLPADRRAYRYPGSLTTPPCTEGVQWVVMARPIELSRRQLRVLTESLAQLAYASFDGTNHRPTQPLHGRMVELDE